MGGKQVRLPFPLSQIVLVLLVVLVAYLAVDFGRQVIISHQRRDALRQVEQEIKVAEDKKAELEKRLLYAQSAEAAEAWARGQGWVQPNEVSVVLVPPEESPSTGVSNGEQESQDSTSYPDMWWDLFFGER